MDGLFDDVVLPVSHMVQIPYRNKEINVNIRVRRARGGWQKRVGYYRWDPPSCGGSKRCGFLYS